MKKLKPLLLTMPLAAAVAYPQAGVAGNPLLDETFSFQLGGAYLNGSVDVGYDIKGGGVADDISLDDLGVDGDELSPYFSARWRFTERFSANFEYFGWQDEGSSSLSGDIEFGDLLIPAGISARGEIDANIYAVTLGYSFIKSDSTDLGVRLGVHIADLSASLEGAGFIGGVATSSAKQTADVTAPLPNIGLFGTFALSDQWAIEADAGYFSLSYGDYDGEVLVASASLEYRFTDNFGIGAGYTFINVDLTVDGDRATERYEFDLQGPQIYLSAGF